MTILDFGVALLEASTRLTGSGEVLGTVGYVAPEQLRGTDVDRRADVYGLGCLFFEALTGRPPFAGKHAMGVMRAVMLDDAPSVSSLRPDVSPALDDLVAAMLAREPADRPADVAHVSEALRAL